MTDQSIFDFNTNGILKHGKSCKDCVKLEIIEDKSHLVESSVDDFTSAENAINIEIESTPLELKFSTTAPYQIKILSLVITNCNKIEVYTEKFEQYLRTIYGEFLDETDNVKTFSFVLNLDSLVDYVMLRCITHEKDFWIYGASLKVLNTYDLKNPYASIDMQNVQKMLSESNVKLTENARKCQGFLESYMANTDPVLQMQSNPKVLTDIVNQSLNDAIQTKFSKIFNEEIQKFITANQVPAEQDTMDMTAVQQNLPNVTTPQSKPSLQSMLDSLPPPRGRPSLEEMMKMINQSPAANNQQSTPPDTEMKTVLQDEFQKLETSISQKLDDFEKRQEDKLNEILKKLDDYNSKS